MAAPCEGYSSFVQPVIRPSSWMQVGGGSITTFRTEAAPDGAAPRRTMFGCGCSASILPNTPLSGQSFAVASRRAARVVGGTISILLGVLFGLQGSIVLAYNGASAEGFAGALLAFGAAVVMLVMQVQARPSSPLARA